MNGKNWVRTYEKGADYLESPGGVLWHEGSPPRWWHRCKPQTRGWLGMNYAERCRCGAMRDSRYARWAGRNSTRRDRARARREAAMPREQVTCGKCGEPYEAVAGSPAAGERLCDSCWAERFARTGRP